MIGLEIQHIDFADKWALIVASIIIVLAGCTIAFYGSVFLLRDFLRKWKGVLNRVGLKGSLSIALALSLPDTFQGKDVVYLLTFSLVLFRSWFKGLRLNRLS